MDRADKLKTILITGGSSGIGRAAALMLAKDGWDIAITCSSSTESASEVVKLCEAEGVKACAIQADIGTMEGIRKTYEEALAFLGHIDVLYNNAGVFIDYDFLDATEEAYDRTMDVNVKGTFFLTQLVARQMVEKGIKGRIINTSSAVVDAPTNTPLDYCTSKGAVESMTKCMAVWLGPHGITVNAVVPCTIPTKLNKWQFDDPVLRENFRKGSVLGELGESEYLAEAVRYLLSENARWTTGTRLVVDGGYTLQK